MMARDYYQVFGLPNTCTQDDIKKVYRKLAVKFHPDKNPDDKYFEERFKELQEAYEVLSDPVRRIEYDSGKGYEYQKAPHRGSKSKEETKQGVTTPDSIATNVEEVYRKIKYSDIDNINKIQLISFLDSILNENLLKELVRIADIESNERIVDTLTGMFKFLTKEEIEKYSVQLVKLSGTNNQLILKIHNKGVEQIREQENDRLFSRVRWIVGIGFVAMLLYFFNANDRTRSYSVPRKNSPNPIPIIDTAPELATTPSRFIGNQLNTGESPYNSYFGRGTYDKNSSNQLEVKNGQELDVIVCLVNYKNQTTVRNEYIRAGDSFIMTRIPDGTYCLKSFFGKDWNPDTLLLSGRLKGCFDTNSGFSVSDRPEDLIQMAQTATNDRVYFSSYTVTLYAVIGGNMESRGISLDAFFKK